MPRQQAKALVAPPHFLRSLTIAIFCQMLLCSRNSFVSHRFSWYSLRFCHGHLLFLPDLMEMLTRCDPLLQGIWVRLPPVSQLLSFLAILQNSICSLEISAGEWIQKKEIGYWWRKYTDIVHGIWANYILLDASWSNSGNIGVKRG